MSLANKLDRWEIDVYNRVIYMLLNGILLNKRRANDNGRTIRNYIRKLHTMGVVLV